MATATKTAPAPGGRVRLQLFWLKIHRWIGLTLLAVFTALALTGSLLVWPDHFDRWVNPARYPASTAAAVVPPSTLIRSAQAALPAGDRVSAIRFANDITAVRAVGQVNGPAPLDLGPPSRAMVWLDPATGAVLATADGAGGFQWLLRAVHGHLLSSSWGRELVALAGLILLTSACTGLWLWWPGTRHLGRALKWRRQASVSMNLHRQGGAIVVLVLALEAFTGVYVSVPFLFAHQAAAPSGTAQTAEHPPAPQTIATPQQDADAVLATARAQLPDARPATLSLPTQNSPEWVVTFETVAGERSVRIADATGAARVDADKMPSAAQRIQHVMEDIHFGNHGPIWQTVVFLSGIALVLLSVTGLLLWLQGRARRLRHAR